jgi:hypothetical protein
MFLPPQTPKINWFQGLAALLRRRRSGLLDYIGSRRFFL